MTWRLFGDLIENIMEGGCLYTCEAWHRAESAP